jgi:hypothetical protein
MDYPISKNQNIIGYSLTRRPPHAHVSLRRIPPATGYVGREMNHNK